MRTRLHATVLLAALLLGAAPLAAQRPQPAGPIRDPHRRQPPTAEELRRRELGKRHTRADHIAPQVLVFGALGTIAGIAWGVSECRRRSPCLPIAGHLIYGVGGTVAGFGAGSAVGTVVGEATYVVRHGRF